MTHVDFTPLFRSMIGFDRLAPYFENAMQVDESFSNYPPYNVISLGEDAYRISIAVAGFRQEDLDIEARENALTVRGERKGEPENATYLYRGIAGRSFAREFRLAEHVRVADAHLENGLLHIDLARELPEAMKPRKVEISITKGGLKKLLEGGKSAA